ncbi:unnamed protein product [Dovyalis caffra]|uniref:AAA-type ATPase N-terminal domain-containing protein n=1 Tax=Dovyalis caffra TaxID=77055 RepID=A0AAV1SI19_9ROSI|nr:unnamed protein product [Dovyalis caffra]
MWTELGSAITGLSVAWFMFDKYFPYQLRGYLQRYFHSTNPTKNAKRLKAEVIKDSQSIVLSMDDCEEVTDVFDGVKWEIVKSYIEHVLKQGKEVAVKNRQRMLCTNNPSKNWYWRNPTKWGSMVSEHPAAFDTLAIGTKMKEGIKKELVKNHNFSKDHILNLVRKRPAVLLSKPLKTLLPKLEFFQSKGFPNPDVVKIISSYPYILGSSLENQLVPAFDFFENFLQSDALAIRAIKRSPSILEVNVESLARIVDVLRDNGVPKKNIALLFGYRPSIVISNLESFKKLIQQVTLMGFNPSKSQFVLAIVLLRSMTTSTWEKKLDVYRRWGLSREEILAAFVKNPWFMGLSEKKITGVMDLFVKNLGWESSYIAKNPSISSYSLEKRLIPRALVLQFLVSKGLVEKSFRSAAFFSRPENIFRRMLIDNNAESTQILKFYKEKLNPSSVKVEVSTSTNSKIVLLAAVIGVMVISVVVAKGGGDGGGDKPDSVLEVFKNHSFSKDHILNLVRRRPEVLLSKPLTTLLPKLEFFQSKGFSTPDVVKIISTYPWILRCSLENQLVPAFDFFEKFFQSDAMVIKSIKLAPVILNVNVESLARIVDVLRDNGVPRKNIALLFRYRFSNLETFKKLIQEVTLMGFHPSKSQFVVAIMCLRSMSTSTWDKKIDVLKRWGLSQDEILAAFVRYPCFMSLSKAKIMGVMDLFVNKLGWDSSYLAKNPSISSYSLEKRLIPRALVLQFLVSKGLVEKSFRSVTFFVRPENKFQQMFIYCYAESTQILTFYEEKLNHSSVVKTSTF